MAKSSALQTALRNHGPMFLFGLLTGIGIIFIWSAKLWDVNIAVVTGIPIAIMATYLVVSLIASGLRIHNEQAGDNLYYMGFLFTLSSLGVSLYRFVGEASIDEIVRNFGIAVTSTICGIAFRILFNQMRRDPVDIERSVRHELAEMTRRVRSELDSSAREFSSYRRSSSQMLVEGFEEIGRQAEQTGAAVQKAIEILSTESIKPIREASEKLAALSEQNLALFEARSKQLNDTADETALRLSEAAALVVDKVEVFGRAIDNLALKAGGMKMPDEVLRLQLQPAVNAIAEVATLQKKLSEEGATLLSQQVSRNAEAFAPLHQLPQKFEEALRPISAIQDLIKEAVAALSAREAKEADATRFDPDRYSQIPISFDAPVVAPDQASISFKKEAAPPTMNREISSSADVFDPPTAPIAPDVSSHPTIVEPELASPVPMASAANDEATGRRSWFKRWQ